LVIKNEKVKTFSFLFCYGKKIKRSIVDVIILKIGYNLNNSID